MGLAGVTVYGAGLVASCVPGLTSVGPELCSAGRSILEARNRFARSGGRGESSGSRQRCRCSWWLTPPRALPPTRTGASSYTGCALPFPHHLALRLLGVGKRGGRRGMDELSGQMREASERAEEASARGDEALQRGWEQTVDLCPYSLWERADTLAGLSAGENPATPPCTSGTLVPHCSAPARTTPPVSPPSALRARASRSSRTRRVAAPSTPTRSARSAPASTERTPGFRELPPCAAEKRRRDACDRPHTDPSWPCTQEESGRPLHCSLECPGATGPADGTRLARAA